jgi:hypothetical protein
MLRRQPLRNHPRAGGETEEHLNSPPDWVRNSTEDLPRYVYMCPHPSRELDELLSSSPLAPAVTS